MQISLRRWIVGSIATFGTMAFVAAAAVLSPAERNGSTHMAHSCPSKVTGPVAPAVPDDA